MGEMMDNSDNANNIAAIRATIAVGHSLSSDQLKQIREAVNNADLDTSEEAMAIMKHDPWATKIATTDAPWLEKIFDATPNTKVKMYALRLLCLYLSEGNRQRGRILNCLNNSIELDKEDWDLLIAACSCAGFVLSQLDDRELALALVKVMRSNLSITNRSARDAVLIASGMKSRDIVLLEQQKGEAALWSRAELAAEELIK
jgi:hypothetical protein